MSEPVTSAVVHDPQRQRFDLRLGEQSGHLTYRTEGDCVVFNHTHVPREFRGRGHAGVLVREALEEARRRGWKIVPACSYVDVYIRRHPEYARLLSGSPGS